MTRRRLLAAIGAVFLVSVLTQSIDPGVRAGASLLPDRLSSQEFWSLSSELSEADGFFRSDNLLSNEVWLPARDPGADAHGQARPRLPRASARSRTSPTSPRCKPAMAFIVDIRRGNLQLHLMYKALFELSADRAEFVSRLFSSKRPDGLDAEIDSARRSSRRSRTVEPSEALYNDEPARRFRTTWSKTHGFALVERRSQGHRIRLQRVLLVRTEHPVLRRPGGRGGRSAADVRRSDDCDRRWQGQSRSYLASEENFAFLKELEARTCSSRSSATSPVRRRFAPSASTLKEHGATVSAFYLSNVEQYL